MNGLTLQMNIKPHTNYMNDKIKKTEQRMLKGGSFIEVIYRKKKRWMD